MPWMIVSDDAPDGATIRADRAVMDAHVPDACLAPAKVELNRLVDTCGAIRQKRRLERWERFRDAGGLIGHACTPLLL